MTSYRRLRQPGATYAFTLCLQEPGSTLLVDRIDLLRKAWAETLRELPLAGQAVVVLPDHLHAIWTEPEGVVAFSERWRRIKARFSHRVGSVVAPRPSLRRRRERGLWQRRFWEHRLRGPSELDRALEVLRLDPVRHGLVAAPDEWRFSSFALPRQEGS
jgi:putative transposase